MGQKAHPTGLRLGVIKSWGSKWFARGKYAQFLKEDIAVRKFIEKKYGSAGLARVEIERAAKNLKINIYSSRPGIIIGKKGSGAESLKDELAKVCGLMQSQLNVYEVKKPDQTQVWFRMLLLNSCNDRCHFVARRQSGTMKAGQWGSRFSAPGAWVVRTCKGRALS